MIRELTMDDYESVRDLVNQVHQIHLSNRPDIYLDGNACSLGYYERIMGDEDNIKYAYVENDKILGIMIGTRQVTNSVPILKPRNIYFIDDIVVDSSCRNKGIGKKLYNYLLDKAKKDGIDSIELTVWAFNKNAIKFYESLGMSPKNIRYEAKRTKVN